MSLGPTSTREAHGLCFRLLFPLAGKTFVQGQPPGCILYTIPNVQFSESYRSELRRLSGRSPDDFALAAVTLGLSSLKTSPTATWSNHPLLEWAALKCICLRSSANQTNIYEMNSDLELVRLAQASGDTNGALWLVEALVFFDNQQDEAAIAALRIAAEKSDWTTDSKNDVRYFSSLCQRAGLSKLDAAIEANIARADLSTLYTEGRIKHHLQRLMTEAVSSTNDARFSDLLNLLVELRKCDWPERSVDLQNAFRFFGPEDELFEAMRNRLKWEPESSTDYIKEREFRQKVFRDYLALQTNQADVSRFWGQADVAQTEKKLRKEIRENFLYRRTMVANLYTNASGACSALFLYLFVVAILQELPFTWLRKMKGVQGRWPRGPKFWICAVVSLAVGAVLGRYFFLALGLFSDGGFGPIDASYSMPASTKAFLISLVLSGALFVAQFLVWKVAKKSENPWGVVLFFGCVYLVAIAAMAYWRYQTVEAIGI